MAANTWQPSSYTRGAYTRLQTRERLLRRNAVASRHGTWVQFIPFFTITLRRRTTAKHPKSWRRIRARVTKWCMSRFV
eukprot:1893295-Prymnesium_polylepis.1